MSGCVCPGDTLTYECTVMGGIWTVWTGSAFNCYEIALLHSRFMNTRTYTCNNGAIVAQSLSVEGNYYTSQLNVTITPDIIGKTIECIVDNGTRSILLYSWVISRITGLSPCIA